MDAKAPDVSDLAWGHKYFSLLFPDKLDDYHNADLQDVFTAAANSMMRNCARSQLAISQPCAFVSLWAGG